MRFHSVLYFCLALGFIATVQAQDRRRIQQELLQRPTDPDAVQRAEESRRECQKVFDSVRHGIAGGNIGLFSQHFGPQVLVNIRGGESGYYSSSQAYYVLENHFKTRKVLRFDLSTIGGLDANPYATGSAWFNLKGSRESAQVYVSLARTGGRWVIAQVNIY